MLHEFDSYQEIKDFTKAGIDEKHAEKIVHLVMRYNKLDVEKLATKEDLKQVEVGLRKDIEQVEVGLRKDIEQVEVGLRKDMEKMEIGLRKEIVEVKFSILKWVLPFMLTNTAAILGIMVKLFLAK